MMPQSGLNHSSEVVLSNVNDSLAINPSIPLRSICAIVHTVY